MDPKRIQALLVAVQGGELSPAEALERLRLMPAEDLGEAVLDHHRTLRAGAPEVVLGEWKTAEQIARLVAALAAHGSGALATRVSPEKAAHVLAAVPGAEYRELARAVVVWPPGRQAAPATTVAAPVPTGATAALPETSAAPPEAPIVAVVCAGTSDLPVAEEAVVTLEFLGHPVTRVTDVGVAGLHRLFPHLERLRRAAVILVVAGMEGALPSVVAGLVHRPVIAVPTSVGYGVSQGGYAALLGMLSSCAAGVLVVNIDNGFGAAVGAARICGSMT